MSNNVYFFRNAIGDSERFLPHSSKIEQLLAGDFHGLHLEKLQAVAGRALYSIRLSKKARLLFTTFNGTVFLCDVLPKHQYETNKFLKNKVFKQFVARLGDDVSALADDDSYALWQAVEQDDPLKALLPRPGLSMAHSQIALELQQGGFIELNDTQEGALCAALPTIINGAAGTGKTCIAISLLRQRMRDYDAANSALPLVYVSHSPALVERVKSCWEETEDSGLSDACVLFKTYYELLHEELPKGMGFADNAMFEAWYAINQGKNSPLSAHHVWAEFRIRSGYANDAGYLALGRRQSRLDDASRHRICQLYQGYLTYLHHEHATSAQLHALSGLPRYQFIVVDEAQDLSYGQLRALNTLVEKSAIAYLLGEHQVLFDGKSRLPYLRQMFHEQGVIHSQIDLRETYRCPQNIMDIANQLIHLKYQVTGGGADKDESGVMLTEKNGGECAWYEPSERDNLAALKVQAKRTNVAVIAHPCEVEKAKALFDTQLVFTPEEIKGLEYDTIVLWQLLNHDTCEKACAVLPEEQTLNASPQKMNRAKANQENEDFLPYFNQLITAVTRAQNKLVIVQASHHRIRKVANALKSVLPLSLSLPDVLAPAPSHAFAIAHRNEWLKEAKKLMALGRKKQVRNILNETLHMSPEEVDLQLAEFIKEQKQTHEIGLFSARKADRAPVITKSPPQQLPSLHTNRPIKKVKSSSSSKTMAIQKVSKTQQALLKLWDNFSESHIKKLLPIMDFDTYWLKAAFKPSEDAVSLSFFEHVLTDPVRGLELTACLVNNVGILANLPNSDVLIALQSFSKQSKQVLGDKFNVLQGLFAKTKQKKNKKLARGSKPLSEAMIKLRRHIISPAIKWGSLVACAAYQGQADVIEVLGELGADMNLVDSATKVGPAMLAAEKGHVPVIHMLGRFGADMNKRTVQGFTPIRIAAQEGHADTIIALHQNGAKVDAVGEEGETAAHMAAEMGHVHAIYALKQLGANLNHRTKLGETPMHSAAKNNRVDVIHSLYEFGADVDLRRHDGATAVLIAAHCGHIDIIKALCQHGADINVATVGGQTCVHVATQRGDLAVLKVLNQLGARMCEPENDGEYPIHAAAQMGFVDILEWLCGLGADVDGRRKDGATPLFLAAYQGQSRTILALHQRGADINYSTVVGQTPLYVAAQTGQNRVIRMLCRLGAKVNCQTTDGRTLAFVAAKYGHARTLELLYELGVDINQARHDGATPAYIAAANGHVDVIQTLFNLGVNLSGQRASGIYPFLVAAKNGHEGVVRLLYFLKADIHQATADGITAVFSAAEYGHNNIVQLLHSFGADMGKANKLGVTPVCIAACLGHVNVLRTLIDDCQVDVNQATQVGVTPLGIASQSGNLDAIRLLMGAGANKAQENDKGESPAFIAAKHGNDKAIKLLHHFGVDINKPRHDGTTPLCVALDRGHVNVSRLLLELGAGDSLVATKGWTRPLINTRHGYKRVLDEIKKLGVDNAKSSLRSAGFFKQEASLPTSIQEIASIRHSAWV